MAERTLVVKLVGDSRSLERTFTKSSKNAQSFATSMGRATKASGGFSRGFLSGAGALSSFGGALALTSGSFFAGAGIVAGLKAAVTAAADFEQTMNVLRQVSHATAAEMALASDEARKLGADISLPATSATDAALAMQQLAKGGLDITQALGAARGTLQLAAAAQTDVGTAANTTARALTAFGLSGDHAGNIADALANAANSATGDIVDFAIGLSQSATSARQFGLSAEDTVTALTELAKAGIVGSDAGTSLRVMLGRLLPASKQAREEMQQLGVHVADASGEFLPFRDIIDQYAKALEGLPSAQRQQALQTIFGTDAQRAANIILAGGVKNYDALHKAVGRQGGAARAAAAQQKGFNGALDGLNSAVSTTAVNLGNVMIPKLTDYLRHSSKWLSDTDNQKELQRDLNAVFKVTTGILETAGSVIQTVDRITGGLKNTLAILVGLKLAPVIAGWVGSLGKLATVAGEAGAAGKIGLLNARLAILARRAAVPITITLLIEVLLNKKKIDEIGNSIDKTVSDALGHVPFFKGSRLDKQFSGEGVFGHKDIDPTAGASEATIELQIARLNKHRQKNRKEIASLNALLKKMAEDEAGVQKKVNDALGGKTTKVPVVKARPRPGLTPGQGNTFFDNTIARILLRGGLGDISAQIAALQRANSLISARLKVTKDVTRRLTLEDELLQNAAQIKSLNAQAAADALSKRQDAMAEFIANLQLGVTRAQATATFTDDIAALQALQKGIRAQIKEFGLTADLAGQLFDAQQNLTQARLQQRTARQFRELGLTATGDEVTPGVKNLQKRLKQLTGNIAGTKLDTPKLRTQLAKFRKVLSEGLVPKDVRAKIRQMMDDIADELKNSGNRNQTKFRHASSNAVLAGLGLTPDQTRTLRSRLSQIGAGGTVPGSRSAAFGGAGAQFTVFTTVNLDGQKVAQSTTKHQQKAQKRRTTSRRGAYAGRH